MAMAIDRPRVLFIGAFATSNPAVRGGQLQACTSLLNSSLAAAVDLILLDSTQVSVPPPRWPTRAARALGRFVAALRALLFARIDAVLVFCADGASFVEKGAVALVARALGKRVVLAPRSGFLIDDYQRSWMWRLLIRSVLRASHVVVCQGQAWRSFFVRAGADPDRCLVIKNWVSVPELCRLPLAKPNRGELKVLYLGWIESVKGIFDLVQAVDDLRQRGRTVRVVVAGDGTAREPLKAELQRRNLESAIALAGWADDTRRIELMAAADVLVMPSYREGLPNAVLEAMAAGRAVIATRVGAVPDVVRDGENGLLFNAGDVRALAAALARLCDEAGLLEALATRARRTIVEEHDLETAARALTLALSGGTEADARSR